MLHNYGMLKTSLRTTVVFSPKTARLLDRLSRTWRSSRSEALRRIIEERAAEEERRLAGQPSPADVVALVKSGEIERLAAPSAEAFLGQVRAERRAAK